MIARVWKGVVASAEADEYASYMQKTGVSGYATTPGNRGVWMLRRAVEQGEEFMMYSLWESIESIKAFAGEDHETAVFYPEDERFLITRELVATHYEVDTVHLPDDGRT